jgi:hypothetical protein
MQQHKKRWRQGTSTFNTPALQCLLTSLLIMNVLRLILLQVLHMAVCTTNGTRIKKSSHLRRCHSNYTLIYQWVLSLRHRRPKLTSHRPTSVIIIWFDFRFEYVTYTQILSKFNLSLITSLSHRRVSDCWVTNYVHRQHRRKGGRGWWWWGEAGTNFTAPWL